MCRFNLKINLSYPNVLFCLFVCLSVCLVSFKINKGVSALSTWVVITEKTDIDGPFVGLSLHTIQWDNSVAKM